MEPVNTAVVPTALPTVDHLEAEVHGPVAVFRISRPDKLNAWTAQMEKEGQAALARAEADDAVRVVILSGAGRGFCSGAGMSADDVAGGAPATN